MATDDTTARHGPHRLRHDFPHAAATPRAVSVAVLGAGIGGIAMAAKLDEAGFTDVTLLERADDVGGTWRDNTYPGAACDVASHLYSLSFAPKSDWSHVYSGQQEIQRYLRDLADRFGIHRRTRFGFDAVRATWDAAAACWTVHARDGRTVRADVLVSAVGALKDPAFPAIPGRDDFAGSAFHSSRWRHDVPLEGRRVGVVGTGASAIQFVPAIAPRVGTLHVFQRTPPWIIPRYERAYRPWERWAFTHVPGFRALRRAWIYAQKESLFFAFRDRGRHGGPFERLALRHLHRQVTDPALRAALTPDYRIACKRVLLSNRYYPALTLDHVRLESTGIERITPSGVRLRDGRAVDLDVLVYGTGFTTDRPLGDLHVMGREGADLATAWRDRPTAYLGITVPRFPNLFLLLGPNTGLGHNSVVSMIEAQVRYVVQALEYLRARHATALEVDAAADAAYQREIAERLDTMVWASGCDSWYLGDDGSNATLWPGWVTGYHRRTRHFDPSVYRVLRPDGDRAPVGVQTSAGAGSSGAGTSAE